MLPAITSSVINQIQKSRLNIMKFLIILICCCVLGYSMTIPQNNPVAVNTPPVINTLSQDLAEIARMIPFGSIRRLAIRYLLNDEQAFVRLINSNDAYITQMYFRSQPEVVAFNNWVHQQILSSGADFQLVESEEDLSIFNRSPFWPNTVYGLQGIVNELFLIYPEDRIRSQVQMKIAQNGIFAEFMQRLQDLKPIYDSITFLPAAQRLAAALEALGINTNVIDTFIRNQFGWQQSRAIIVLSSTTPVEENSTKIFADISATTVATVSAPVPVA